MTLLTFALVFLVTGVAVWLLSVWLKVRAWGIPWWQIPDGPFEGSLYFWCVRPPFHSARFDKGIYIKRGDRLWQFSDANGQAIQPPRWWNMPNEKTLGWFVLGYQGL